METKRTREDIIKQIDCLKKLNKANESLIQLLESELKLYPEKNDN